MSLTRTLTVHCDRKPCSAHFVAKSDSVGQAKFEAREAGWYFGVGETAYCQPCTVAIGIRVTRRTRAAS